MGYFSAGIAAYAALEGDKMSAEGAQATNQMSVDVARMNNEFNSAEAQKNRDFQENMADTQMQRRMADLSKSNLNPALAYTQGGAAAPGGSAASSVGNPNLQNPNAAYGRMGDQISSALDLRSKSAQIDALEAQANKANVESGTEIPATVARIQSETGLNDVQAARVQRNVSMMDILLKPYGDGPGATSLYQSSAESDNALKALQVRISQMDVNTQDQTMDTLIKVRNNYNLAESLNALNIYDASDGVFGRIMAYFNLGKTAVSSAAQIGGLAASVMP